MFSCQVVEKKKKKNCVYTFININVQNVQNLLSEYHCIYSTRNSILSIRTSIRNNMANLDLIS